MLRSLLPTTASVCYGHFGCFLERVMRIVFICFPHNNCECASCAVPCPPQALPITAEQLERERMLEEFFARKNQRLEEELRVADRKVGACYAVRSCGVDVSESTFSVCGSEKNSMIHLRVFDYSGGGFPH